MSKILLIEDDGEQAGFEVITIALPDDSLDIRKEQRNSIELIILD